MGAINEIRPQPGPQTQFLSSPADIAIYGGGAGGGKTWALLMEPLWHSANPDFGAVFFRRTTVQIRNEGGLWGESVKLYNARQRCAEGSAGKTLTTPMARRDAALRAMRDHDISQRRACTLVGVDPKTVRRERPPDNPEIRKEMSEIAEKRRRFGYRRFGILLERKGIMMNHKKLYRLYREEGLAVRRRRGRKRARGSRSPTPQALRPNQR